MLSSLVDKYYFPVPPKCWYQCTKLHGVTFIKILIFIGVEYGFEKTSYTLFIALNFFFIYVIIHKTDCGMH